MGELSIDSILQLLRMVSGISEPFVNGIFGTNDLGQGLLDLVNGKSQGYARQQELMSLRNRRMTKTATDAVEDRLANNYLINGLMLTGMTRDAAEKHVKEGGAGVEFLRTGASMLTNIQVGDSVSDFYKSVASRIQNYRESESAAYMRSWQRTMTALHDDYEKGEFGNTKLADIFNISKQLVDTGRYDRYNTYIGTDDSTDRRTAAIKADLKKMTSSVTRLKDVMGLELPELFEKLEQLTGTSLAVLGQNGAAGSLSKTVQHAMMFNGVTSEQWAHYTALQVAHNNGVGTQELAASQALIVAGQMEGSANFRGVNTNNLFKISQTEQRRALQFGIEIETLREAMKTSTGKAVSDDELASRVAELGSLEAIVQENQRLLGENYGITRNSNYIMNAAATSSTVNLASDMQWLTEENRALNTSYGKDLKEKFGDDVLRISSEEFKQRVEEYNAKNPESQIHWAVADHQRNIAFGGFGAGFDVNTKANALRNAHEEKAKRERNMFFIDMVDDSMWTGTVNIGSFAGLLERAGKGKDKAVIQDFLQAFMGLDSTISAEAAELIATGQFTNKKEWDRIKDTMEKSGGLAYFNEIRQLSAEDRERFKLDPTVISEIDKDTTLNTEAKEAKKKKIIADKTAQLKVYNQINAGKTWGDLIDSKDPNNDPDLIAYKAFVQDAFDNGDIDEKTYNTVMYGIENKQLISITDTENTKQFRKQAEVGYKFRNRLYAGDEGIQNLIKARDTEIQSKLTELRQSEGYSKASTEEKARLEAQTIEQVKNKHKTTIDKAYAEKYSVDFDGITSKANITVDQALARLSMDMADDGELTDKNKANKELIVKALSKDKLDELRASEAYTKLDTEGKKAAEESVISDVTRSIDSAISPGLMSQVELFLRDIFNVLLNIKNNTDKPEGGK